MGTGFSKKKKEARNFKDKLAEMQEMLQSQMKAVEVEGSAGNGLVTVKLNGDNTMLSLKIKPDCVDKEDIEGLEDLIKAAYNDALEKLRSQATPKIPGLPDLSSFGF